MFDIILEASNNYDWIIISIGTAGEDEQQQCPTFARQLATQEKVVIYNMDPGFTEDNIVDEKSLTIFRLKTLFPFHRNTQSCQILSENFRNLISELLKSNKKVVLLTCAIPALPDAFLMAAYENKQFLESSNLFVIGSYVKDFLTIVYNPIFLKNWYEAHLHNNSPLIRNTPKEHTAFWSWMKKPTDTYYSLGDNEESRDARFKDIQTQFASMGKIVKTLKDLHYEDLTNTIAVLPKIPSALDESLQQLKLTIHELSEYASSSKQQTIVDLAESLEQKVEGFFNGHFFIQDTTTMLRNFHDFKSVFTKELHSEDRIINTKAKQIVLNILIALTGIGTILLCMHGIKSYYQTGQCSLFFQKGVSLQEHVSHIEAAVEGVDEVCTSMVAL